CGEAAARLAAAVLAVVKGLFGSVPARVSPSRRKDAETGAIVIGSAAVFNGQRGRRTAVRRPDRPAIGRGRQEGGDRHPPTKGSDHATKPDVAGPGRGSAAGGGAAGPRAEGRRAARDPEDEAAGNREDGRRAAQADEGAV